ncbi:MAG: phosphatidate cytidylyltransferase [Elusimicrobia bacterium]|nr:phosphatidate cytidylyltransferase [Elusimicrobiota bacterium]MBU2615247.1 phosphatidate cytidylyltransferase [Elusimicrobiota bacterium]
MILPRLLTAIIGIPIILLAIHFGDVPFFILVIIIVLFSLQEYFFIIDRTQFNLQKANGYIFGLLIMLAIYFNGSKILSPAQSQLTSIVFTLALLAFFCYEILRIGFSNRTEVNGSIIRIALTLFGLFIISWTFGHILLLRDINPNGNKYSFFLFLLIWIADTGAYLVGKRFGRMKLAEKISPQKTVEGALGGIVIGIIFALAMWKIFALKELKLIEVIVVSFFIIVIGFISDLSESLLKRDVGLKDSDVLLPGHGGMLDRFDSFIFAAPFFYYYLTIFHK